MNGNIKLCLAVLIVTLSGSQAWSANPIMQAADPDIILVEDTVWLYGTHGRGGRFYTFSSSDLVNWQRHGPILQFDDIDWIQGRRGAWAPGIIERDGTYYLYYSVGPKPSHIGVAWADDPAGPFTDSGQALLSDYNEPGFEAIDAMVFQDPNSGKYYFYAGGSAGATLRVFELNDDMISFAGEVEVETPPYFTEGAFMHYRDGKYYLSYSHGSWRHASYSVHYATSDSPVGPWDYQGPILQSDDTYKGPGHHSFLENPHNGQWYIFYHRYEGVEGDGPYRVSRVAAVDKIHYDQNGLIKPVVMTAEGVHYDFTKHETESEQCH